MFDKLKADSTRRRFMATGVGTAIGGTALTGWTAADTSATESESAASVTENRSSKSTTTSDGTGFSKAVDAGLSYFRERAGDQLPLVETLATAIEDGDMDRAKTAYVKARPPYEEIEVLAASFEQTDSNIDARPVDFAKGETSEKFRGFHRIERLLYREDDLEAAVPYAHRLTEDVKRLQHDLERREQFGPKKSFAGMIGLANEVATKKITSEEETFSDQSLLIFRQNWRGIHNQFEPFAPAVAARDAAVAREEQRAYEAAQSVLEPYFDYGCLGATSYRSVGNDKRNEIVHASYRYRDALIDAAKVLGLAE